MRVHPGGSEEITSAGITTAGEDDDSNGYFLDIVLGQEHVVSENERVRN